MSETEWDELLARHLEGELSEEAAGPVWERIAADREVRQQYRELRDLHHDLRRTLWSNPQRDEAFLQGVLNASAPGRADPRKFAENVASRFCEEERGNSRRPKSKSARVRRLGTFAIPLAAAAVVALGVTLFLFFRNRGDVTETVVAFVISGQATVKYGERTVAASSGSKLNAGGRVLTAKDAQLSFRYDDGSIVEVGADTDLTLSDEGGAKRIVLERGTLSARAAKQPPNLPWVLHTPAADATVVGTVFELSFTDQQSVLRVAEGEVRFGNAQKEVSVTGGKFSSAMLGQAPTAPENIVPDGTFAAGNFPSVNRWHVINRYLKAEIDPRGFSVAANSVGFVHLVAKDPVELAEGQTLVIRATIHAPAPGDGGTIQVLDADDPAFGARAHLHLTVNAQPTDGISFISLYIRRFTDAPADEKLGPYQALYASKDGFASAKGASIELSITATTVRLKIDGTDCGSFKHGLTLHKWRPEFSLFSPLGKRTKIEWRDISILRE